MNIERELDYKTILRNSSRPVHLVARLTAPAEPLTQRALPSAFTVVLDRSGSMGGAPIEHAKQACRDVIKNLRPEDCFSQVVFDSSAQVITPWNSRLTATAGIKPLIRSRRVKWQVSSDPIANHLGGPRGCRAISARPNSLRAG
jgi:secreted protein with Ig-like and vWFA domain